METKQAAFREGRGKKLELGYGKRARTVLRRRESCKTLPLPDRRGRRWMDGLAWDAVRDEFDFDGSWRDIYVLGIDMATWQRMLDGLRAAGYDIAYFRDGQPAELPTDANQAFPLPDECDRMLSVRFVGVLANCHFFTPDEIEFDIDPRDVKGQEQLDALFRFMRSLAEIAGKEAILTAENCPEKAIFRVRPGHLVIEHRVFGGWHDWR